MQMAWDKQPPCFHCLHHPRFASEALPHKPDHCEYFPFPWNHFVSEALPQLPDRCEYFPFPWNHEAVPILLPRHPWSAGTWVLWTGIAVQGCLPYRLHPMSTGLRCGCLGCGRLYACWPSRVWPIPLGCVPQMAYSCPLLSGQITFQGEQLQNYIHHSWQSNDLENTNIRMNT